MRTMLYTKVELFHHFILYFLILGLSAEGGGGMQMQYGSSRSRVTSACRLSQQPQPQPAVVAARASVIGHPWFDIYEAGVRWSLATPIIVRSPIALNVP